MTRFGTSQISIGRGKTGQGPADLAPPLSMAKKRLGVRAVNADDLAQFETWLGAKADAILVFTDSGTWANCLTKAQNEGSAVAGLGRELSWAVPLTVTGTSLAAVAAGGFDSHFQQLADIILSLAAGDGPIVMRLGWEQNLSPGYPWSAIGFEADYIAAFRHVVPIFRAKSPRFKIDWCINWGRAQDPMTFYPGDGYCDIVSQDCYMDAEFDQNSGQTGAQAWAYKLSATYGLNYLVNFGIAHGKPIGLTEWGVNNDVPDYIAAQAAWVRANNVYYHHYWNSNSGKQDRLSDGQYPNAAAEFIKQYGAISITSTSVMAGVAGNAIVKTLAASKAVTWSIVEDATGLFSVAGASLTLAAGARTGSYKVTVEATDERGVKARQVLTATVKATADPWTFAAAFGADLVDEIDVSISASVVRDGSNLVSQVNSQVGSPGVRNFAQGSAGSKPLYSETARLGLPGIAFDGSNDYLTQSVVTGIPGNQEAIGIFLACYGDAALATFKYLLSLGDSTGHGVQVGSGSSGNVRVQDTGSVTSAPTLIAGDRVIAISIPAGATPTVSLSVDGNTVVTAAVSRAAIATITRMVLGGECTAGGGVGNYFKGVIKHLAIVKRGLTQDEIDNGAGYLAWKWGTVANLPSNHPRKLAPPTL